jgi:hypothetical protein
MARVASARRAIPSLDHDRPYGKSAAKENRLRAAGE